MNKPKHARTNFRRLLPYIGGMAPADESDTHRKFSAEGFMDLNIEYLYCNDHNGFPIYSMAQYGKQYGDVMKDPDFTFSVDWESGVIDPRSYENSYWGVFDQVYIQRDGQTLYSRRMRIDLDEFLYSWLDTIEQQGYSRIK